MSTIINWNELLEIKIPDQLKKRLETQKQKDRMFIEETFEKEDVCNQLKKIDESYAMYNEKIKLMDNNFFSNSSRNLSIMVSIDCMKGISDSKKVRTMISYGVLVNEFRRINERTDEEILMLSACSTELRINDYLDYMEILSDENVSRMIVTKSSEIDEQEEIAKIIMNAIDKTPHDYINTNNHEYLVEIAVGIINNYKKCKTK